MNRTAHNAFENAIARGYLNADPNSDMFAGHWMYMFSKDKGDQVSEIVDSFKNIDTREYMHVAA